MTKKKKPEVEHYAYCHSCQLERGAKVPDGGQRGITVTFGLCPLCKNEDTMIPNVDYDWPETGKKAIFD